MDFSYRVTRDNALDLNLNALTLPEEDLIKTPADAVAEIEKIERQLTGKVNKHRRGEMLYRRAIIYQGLGDPRMLETAIEAYRFSRTAHTAFAVGLGYHFHGRMQEAFKCYEEAYKLPHQRGADMNIAFAYIVRYLFSREWDKAWPLLAGNCKRVVYALRQQNGGRLPEWNKTVDTKEVSLIQEGGFGDIIQYYRYLPYFSERGIKMTAYMTPTFFKSGFVDLLKRQDYPVEFKSAKEIPSDKPAIGFLDLNFILGVKPDAVPQYHQPFQPCPDNVEKYSHIRRGPHGKPRIGFTWSAREKESQFVRAGAYRSLTEEQAQRVIAATQDKIEWINLQHGVATPNTRVLNHDSWDDTAGVIANCDAIVSIDSAPMHLAGAMGKPIYTLCSGMLEWKFGLPEQGDGCLWYPSMKIFRNEAFGFENSINKLIDFLRRNY